MLAAATNASTASADESESGSREGLLASLPHSVTLEQLWSTEKSRTPKQKNEWKRKREEAVAAMNISEQKIATMEIIALMRSCYKSINIQKVIEHAQVHGTKRAQVLFQKIIHIGATHVKLMEQEVPMLHIPAEKKIIIPAGHEFAGAMIRFELHTGHHKGRDSHAHIFKILVALYIDKDYRHESDSCKCSIQ